KPRGSISACGRCHRKPSRDSSHGSSGSCTWSSRSSPRTSSPFPPPLHGTSHILLLRRGAGDGSTQYPAKLYRHAPTGSALSNSHTSPASESPACPSQSSYGTACTSPSPEKSSAFPAPDSYGTSRKAG